MASRCTRVTPRRSISPPWTGTVSARCTAGRSSPSARVSNWKRPPLPVKPLGTSGEALAEDHLRGLGYAIVGRDVRTPLGQLDLVAKDGSTLVFVEVKTRAGHGFGLPQESVDARKIRKLRQLALYYLKIRPYRGPIRFDVVGLTVTDGRLVRVDHIKNAID